MSTGRPTKYRDEYAEQAEKLSLLGLTNEQLATYFDVDVATIYRWKNEFPDFCDALKAGKEDADANVARSLYQRAMGYSHKAVKIVADAKTGSEHIVEYTEKFPPETTAAIFWLKNRQPGTWRDQRAIEHINKPASQLTDAELERIAATGSAGTTDAQKGPEQPDSVH